MTLFYSNKTVLKEINHTKGLRHSLVSAFENPFSLKKEKWFHPQKKTEFCESFLFQKPNTKNQQTGLWHSLVSAFDEPFFFKKEKVLHPKKKTYIQ
jgi:hypothetical protein